MKGLWVHWWIVFVLVVLNLFLGMASCAVFCAAGFVISAIILATSIIVEEIKNVRKG